MKKKSTRKIDLKKRRNPTPLNGLHITRKQFFQEPNTIADILHTTNSIPSRKPRLSSQYRSESLNQSLINQRTPTDTISKLSQDLILRDQEIKSLKKQSEKKVRKLNSIILEIYKRVSSSPLRVLQLADKETLEKVQIDQNIHLKDLIFGLEMAGHQINASDVQDFLKIFPSTLPIELFLKLISKSQKVPIPDEIKVTLEHLKMRMQVNNVPKNHLGIKLFGKNYDHFSYISRENLKGRLSQPPFSILKIDELDNLCRFLISAKPSAENIVKKLMKFTEDWTIQPISKLETLDEDLSRIVSNFNCALQYECKKHDPDSYGVLPVALFIRILKEFDKNIDEDMENHIRTLAYSYTYKLNVAPYVEILNQFVVTSDEESETDRISLVKKYLAVIYKHLTEHNHTVMSAFESNNGYIMLEDFAKGLARIGLGEIEDNIKVMLIEDLQSDHFEDKVCIDLRELEMVLSHYYGETKSLQTVESSASIVIHEDFIKKAF